MSGKTRTKQKSVQASDLTEDEVDAWIAANKASINKDLAAARKGLRAGKGRPWDFSKFLARAKKRAAAKNKKKK